VKCAEITECLLKRQWEKLRTNSFVRQSANCHGVRKGVKETKKRATESRKVENDAVHEGKKREAHRERIEIRR